MKRRWIVTALGAALGASCGDTTPTAATQLNLDRPVDISFACYGDMRVTNGMAPTVDQPIIPTAQPTESCNGWSPLSTTVVPGPQPGQEDLKDPDGNPIGVSVRAPRWYGFILESAPGTVAIATWGTGPASAFIGGTLTASVLDADPLTPGKNAISVGEEPIAIATDKAGCYEVTANAGSCDLSVLNINSALDDLVPVAGKPATPVVVDRLEVKNAAGAVIRAKPAAMVAEPNTKVVGNECADTASGLVYVAYPSCHLVAAVDASTGKIVKGIHYDDLAAPPTLTDGNVTCPAECPDPDGKLGTIISGGGRPVTLALEFDDRPSVTTKAKRLVIGADNSPAITLVELDDNFLPMSLSQIALQNTNPTSKLGITSIAMSPQIGMGGAGGNVSDTGSNGGPGQYVYAVATDNTVRVADVFDLNAECDTQVDTRFVRGISDVKPLQCFKVGDPATPQRRAGAKGPGIELIGDGVPTSVAFVKALPILNSTGDSDTRTAGPTTLLGTFAIITASNGQAFVVNVDDDNNPRNPTGNDDVFYPNHPQSTAPTLIMAHQLRDSINAVNRDLSPTVSVADPADSTQTIDRPFCNGFTVASDPLGGGPHVTAAPSNNVGPDLPVAVAKALELPSIRQVECMSQGAPGDPEAGTLVPVSELQLSADPPLSDSRDPKSLVRDHVFPDLRSLFSDENWSLTWEGPLAQDATAAGTPPDGPTIRAGQMFVDSAAQSRIDDHARPFCEMGVEPFDILQLRGCNPLNGNADCPAGYRCYVHPDASASVVSVAGGACMLSSEASRLANACRDFLISRRQYTIDHAASGELTLLPRKHVLRTTPLDGCTGDAQCVMLADYDAQNARPGIDSAQAPNRNTWACMVDDKRAPVNGDPTKKRCVQTCAFHDNDPKHKDNPGYDGVDRDLDCDRGTICQGAKAETATTPAVRGVCMESVMPPQACVNGPQRYDVRASEAFTVIGSHSGYIHPIIEVPPINEHGGKCDRNPAVTASSLQSGRIPLEAAACGDPLTTDPITGALSGGGFEANPCSLDTPQAEYQRTCPANTMGPVAERTAPAIKFRTRGMTLTVVDPYYPGDQACVGDRKGFPDPNVVRPIDHVPLVFQGYQLVFHQTAGWKPLTLLSVNSVFNPVYPVKVVAGPTNSIWVLDNGDFLSTTIGLPSTRGQVYRIESSSLGTVNVLDRLQ